MNSESATKNRDFTTTITVDQTPQQAFEAIIAVRAWWSGAIEGPTDELGGEFTYRYKELHYTRQRVTELVPGNRVVWLVTDSDLDFVEDKHEWTGTSVVFDIARKGDKTEVRFTHAGLTPERECYGACSKGWGFYIGSSLRSLIATGKGEPNAQGKSRGNGKDHQR
ncbi:MAG TPA: SRPBCC domain-containing protein [Polyangiaceae bacterium]|jgi:hypothetical protein